jgi:hypothetical protein
MQSNMTMNDVNKALADIHLMRSQLTAHQRFLGFTPPIIALTGFLAFGLAGLQSLTGEDNANIVSMLTKWVVLAALVCGLIGLDAILRAKAAHQLLADRMLMTTMRQFAPASALGAVVGGFILLGAPVSAPILPGLWQLLVALGLFTALPNLPKSMAFVVAFYSLAGIGSLALSSAASFSPWIMGAPFGIGQLLVALVLHHSRLDGYNGQS